MVVFPAPLGPTKAVTEPSSTKNEVSPEHQPPIVSEGDITKLDGVTLRKYRGSASLSPGWVRIASSRETPSTMRLMVPPMRATFKRGTMYPDPSIKKEAGAERDRLPSYRTRCLPQDKKK